MSSMLFVQQASTMPDHSESNADVYPEVALRLEPPTSLFASRNHRPQGTQYEVKISRLAFKSGVLTRLEFLAQQTEPNFPASRLFTIRQKYPGTLLIFGRAFLTDQYVSHTPTPRIISSIYSQMLVDGGARTIVSWT